MYTLKNLRNMMKNHTGMLVLLVISMFVSFGVLFFGVGLYYQYSKNIEDGEIAVLTPRGVKLYDGDKNELHRDHAVISWDVSAAEKGG